MAGTAAPSTSSSIIRWATKPSISRTKSSAPAFSISSDSCMLSLVIGFFLMVRLKLCNSTLPKFSDDPPIAPAELACRPARRSQRLSSYTTSWDTPLGCDRRGSRRASPACPASGAKPRSMTGFAAGSRAASAPFSGLRPCRFVDRRHHPLSIARVNRAPWHRYPACCGRVAPSLRLQGDLSQCARACCTASRGRGGG